MKNKFTQLISILFILTILISGYALAESVPPPSQKVVAVLPFINYSTESNAIPMVMEQLFTQLESNHVNYISNADLRPLLRKNRIRSIGFINKEEVAVLLNSLKIDMFLIGSIDIFNNQSNPEISISIRMLDPERMHIIAAETYAASGSDFEKLFGTGIIGSIDSLTNISVKALVKQLVQEISLYEQASSNTKQTVAIIPLDNITEEKRCGKIADNLLLTTLVQSGYNVIEPGMIKEIMSKNRRILRGEVDFETLQKINEDVEVDMIVTGAVEQYQIQRGSSQPEIEIGLRTLDASNGKIISMFNDRRKGNDSESVFEHGKINAMGNLLKNSFTSYIKTLEKKSEKYFAKHN